MVDIDEINVALKKRSFNGQISLIERLTNGWTNLTLKLTDESNDKIYILREYLPGTLREISLENIEFELNFLKYLFEEMKLPVAPMLEPPGLFQINNQNYCVLFPFIQGIKYLNTPETPVRQLWQTIEISRFLGRMHSNLHTKQLPLHPKITRRSINFIRIKYELVNSCPEFETDHPDLYKRIFSIIDQHTKSIPLIEDETEQDQFEKSFEKDLPIGYIHADIHDDNVLFDSNENRLSAVLDFDDMYIGPLILDVAMCLCLWCSVGSTFRFDFAKEFLINYQNERKENLTDKEFELLEVYCYLTILNQILFTIECDECARPIELMIDELLLPIEFISKERKLFYNLIEEIKRI